MTHETPLFRDDPGLGKISLRTPDLYRTEWYFRLGTATAMLDTSRIKLHLSFEGRNDITLLPRDLGFCTYQLFRNKNPAENSARSTV